MRPDGKPLSWAHYVYGMSRLPRSHAIANLAHAEALAVAFNGGDAWDNWNRRQREVAGF